MENTIKAKEQKLAALRENFPESARIYCLYGKVSSVIESIQLEGGGETPLDDAKSILFDEIGELFLASMLNEIG